MFHVKHFGVRGRGVFVDFMHFMALLPLHPSHMAVAFALEVKVDVTDGYTLRL